MALNDVVYNKTVDVAQSMPVPVVFAKQNENGKRKVIVTLLKNGQPFLVGTDISGYIQGATAPNPATKQPVRFKRDLTLIDAEGNASTITFVIAESMTAEIGITQCEIALYDSTKPNEILCTANINIEVQGTGMSLQDEMASDDYQAIVSIKAEVTAMRDEVRTKTNQAIAAQAAAETAAQNAYNSALGVQKIVAGNEVYTKQETDLKYSVAPRKAQTSTTGELKLTDADYGLSYLELQGNSEQYTNTASANLFDAEYNKSLGLDATDKYLRTTGEIDISVGWSYSYYIKVVPNTLYSFVGVPASPAASFVFYTKDKTYISGISTKDAVIDLVRAVTTPNNCEWMRISYGYNNQTAMYLGQPPSQGVIGAVDTPSPEYPSEVKSVGDIPKDVNGVEIRNLLDEDYLKNPDHWSVQGESLYYVKLSPSVAKLFGAAYKISHPSFAWRSILYLSETLTAGVNMRITLVNNAGGTQSGSYTFPSADPIYLIAYNRNADEITKAQFIDELFKCYKLMITEAAEIDEYRPYIGENNGLVKIESSGINRAVVGNGPILTGNRGNIEVNTWTPGKIVLTQKNKSTSWAYVELNLERGKTYTFYCKAKVEVIEGTQTDGITKVGFRQYPPGGIMYGQTILSQDGQYKDIYNTTGVIPNDVPNMAFMIYLSSTNASNGNIKMTIDDLMVVEGEKTLQEMKAIKYHPYHQQVTWIPLREPLRGLTGANLKLYADKVDKNGYVTQNIYLKQGKDMATFDTDTIGINTSSNPYKYAYWKVQVATELPYWSTISVLCNMLKRRNYNVNQTAIANTAVVVFNLPNTLTGLADAETDKAAITAAIKAWVNTNNPMVYYALKNPIEYQIPMVYIETYDQETNVRCLNKVKPSSMGLDYKIAISSLIKRLEALESAAVNNGGK